jgi:hypothetical protein
MLKRLMRIFLVFVIALAATMPVGARAMQMPAGTMGLSVDHPCSNCPDRSNTGTKSGMMPACQILACAGAIAMLPAPTLLPGRTFLRATFLMAPPVRWTKAADAPDPFPPRLAALI